MDQLTLSDPSSTGAGGAERESRRLRTSVVRASEKTGELAERADRSPLTRGPF